MAALENDGLDVWSNRAAAHRLFSRPLNLVQLSDCSEWCELVALHRREAISLSWQPLPQLAAKDSQLIAHAKVRQLYAVYVLFLVRTV